MAINSNSFEQSPVRGALDLQIQKSGVISGVIGAGQATSVKAGDWLKLDATVTSGYTPNFLKATASEEGVGPMIFSVQKATIVAGDPVQVGFLGGPVIWELAGDTIAPGEALEMDGSGNLVPLAAAARRGFALDPAVSGQLFRMIVNPAPAA